MEPVLDEIQKTMLAEFAFSKLDRELAFKGVGGYIKQYLDARYGPQRDTLEKEYLQRFDADAGGDFYDRILTRYLALPYETSHPLSLPDDLRTIPMKKALVDGCDFGSDRWELLHRMLRLPSTYSLDTLQSSVEELPPLERAALYNLMGGHHVPYFALAADIYPHVAQALLDSALFHLRRKLIRLEAYDPSGRDLYEYSYVYLQNSTERSAQFLLGLDTVSFVEYAGLKQYPDCVHFLDFNNVAYYAHMWETMRQRAKRLPLSTLELGEVIGEVELSSQEKTLCDCWGCPEEEVAEKLGLPLTRVRDIETRILCKCAPLYVAKHSYEHWVTTFGDAERSRCKECGSIFLNATTHSGKCPTCGAPLLLREYIEDPLGLKGVEALCKAVGCSGAERVMVAVREMPQWDRVLLAHVYRDGMTPETCRSFYDATPEAFAKYHSQVIQSLKERIDIK